MKTENPTSIGRLSKLLSVNQLVKGVQAMVDSQGLKNVMIKGEIVDAPKISFGSGHMYFTLGDEHSTVRCIVFNEYVDSLLHIPHKGDEVFVRADVTIYEKSSYISLRVYELQHVGTGERGNSLEDLKQKLFLEGIFSQSKKRVPINFPSCVGIITAPNSAALHDITKTFTLHNPLPLLRIYPATMQGKDCCASICSALRFANSENLCDTIIIARGGGSDDDLSEFNNEILVRTVAESKIPIISAIGHEINLSLVDMAADIYVSTPTAAVIHSTCSIAELYGKIDNLMSQLRLITKQKISDTRQKLNTYSSVLNALSPTQRLTNVALRLDNLSVELRTAMQLKLNSHFNKFNLLVTSLEALSPLAILSQGYSILSDNGRIINSVYEAEIDKTIDATLCDGKISMKITNISYNKD